LTWGPLHKSKILWFTGLSGSGKSTLVNRLYDYLIEKNYTVKILDGDQLRSKKHQDLDFSEKAIIQNNKRVIGLCLKDIEFFDYILVSVITPFRHSRELSRKLLKRYYVEIFVKASLDSVIKRDTKGYYKKALDGEISNFIGISDNVPYQIPDSPEITVDTNIESEEYSFCKILRYLYVKKL
jgi:adenylyl-sulfate kinase